MRLLSITAFLFSFAVLMPNSFAATGPVVDYILIENQIDNEFFIAADNLNSRFSGSNVFTKYQRDRQDSLGYMGYRGSPFSSTYNRGDIWLENSPVKQPFIGNRCRTTTSSSCPGTSYWPAEQLRDNGVYKVQQANITGGSNYSRPILSETFYHWLAAIPPGTEYTFDLRSCTSKNDYNLSNTTCMNSGGEIETTQDYIPTYKRGHIILRDTGALQEVFVDSNGIPTIALGANLCYISIVGGVQGIICKLVELESIGSSIRTRFTIRMYIDRVKLGLTREPTSNSIKFKGSNSSNWANWSSSSTSMTTFFDDGSKYIEVFFSNNYLKSLVDALPNSAGSLPRNVYTFAFRSILPQSGYYEFTPSNNIIIKPKNYGISIIPASYNLSEKKTGKVSSEEPIEFNYIVTTTGPRQANTITAKVEGPQTILKGQSYCLFTSDDNKLKVPFSAYLSFKNGSGVKELYRASCDNKEISLKNALWAEIPWDRPYESLGSFYRTNLDLSFPMNDTNSFFTLDGIDWFGTVSASGNITVKAIWVGPDIQ